MARGKERPKRAMDWEILYEGRRLTKGESGKERERGETEREKADGVIYRKTSLDKENIREAEMKMRTSHLHKV